MPSTVMTIKQASLFLADDMTALDTAPDFTCQVTSAAINATPNLQTVPATFCGGESQAPAATGWQIDVTILQDWSAATPGMSEYLFDNDAALKAYRIQPTDPNAIGMEGECYLVAGSYLGDAGTPLTATVTFPCTAKPTKIPLTPLVAATGATEVAGAAGSWTPAGSTPAANLAAMATVTANPLTVWGTGSHMVLGDASQAHWDGAAWVVGSAP